MEKTGCRRGKLEIRTEFFFGENHSYILWHNLDRKSIKMPLFTCDEELAKEAQGYFEKNLNSTTLHHSKTAGQRENLLSTTNKLESCRTAITSRRDFVLSNLLHSALLVSNVIKVQCSLEDV